MQVQHSSDVKRAIVSCIPVLDLFQHDVTKAHFLLGPAATWNGSDHRLLWTDLLQHNPGGPTCLGSSPCRLPGTPTDVVCVFC